QNVPTLANGIATAGDWISAASFISMAGAISFLGYDGSMYLMGWTGGYVLIALLIAPYLRKFGQYTIPDFVGDRYYSQIARFVSALTSIFICLVYITGQMRGVGIIFSRFLQVDVNTGIVIGIVLVGLFAILGGMRGITWTQIAQYSVFCLAFLIPATALAHQLTGIPIPQVAFATSDILEQLNQIHADLGFAAYTEPFAHHSPLDLGLITLTLMLGTAGLPHIIVRFYTVKNMRAARFSAGWALVFIAIFYTAAPAVASFARYSLISTLNQQPIETVQQIDWVRKWESTHLFTLTDINEDGFLQLTPDPATNEITIDPDTIVLSVPEVASLAPWIAGLVAAGGLAAALSTAAGLLLVISSSIAHDIYYRMVNSNASESQRVMVGRLMVGVALAVSGYLGVHPPGFVAQVVAFAFGLAASSFFPVITLGIFDKRTNREGAIAGMLVGVTFTACYVIGAKFYNMPLWLFNISPEGIGAVGMVLNGAVAIGVSRLTPPPPQEVQALVDELRTPGDEPPRRIDIYYTFEERLEFQNVKLKELNQELEVQVQERREAEKALQSLTQELEARVEQRTSELQQALQELQDMQVQLIQTEKMSALGNLVAGIAHEVNNPVNFIQGNLRHLQGYTEDLLHFISLYQQQYPSPTAEIESESERIDLKFICEDLPRMLSSMKLGTERISEIILSLRNFSRMDEVGFKEVNIHEGIDSTLLILQHRIKAQPSRSAIQILKNYSQVLPLVECNAGAINQVFMNILSNAIDAIEECQECLTLQESLANPGQIEIKTTLIDADWAQISIIDNGVGIPEAIQKQIFDPFFTTKPVGKGTGMGMSISYRIITEKHGGRLQCISTPGNGAKFIIQIPCYVK
ncbi:MAG: hypothetical protein F6K16_31810, partial [Symploca sp. SIO2B6]|nr:hypothetical protein [Symploca sp. SIO2B6]